MLIPRVLGLPTRTADFRRFNVRVYGGFDDMRNTGMVMYWNADVAIHQVFFEDLVHASFAGLIRFMSWSNDPQMLEILFKCRIRVGAYMLTSVYFLY